MAIVPIKALFRVIVRVSKVVEPIKGFKENLPIILAGMEDTLGQTMRKGAQRDPELIHLRENGLDHGRHAGHGEQETGLDRSRGRKSVGMDEFLQG